MSMLGSCLVGASHMNSLAECMALAYQGFRPRDPIITDLANQLAQLNLGNMDTVVLGLLSNCAFVGTDTAELPTEAIRAGGGGGSSGPSQ
jgi:hypothetical protein